MSGERDDVYTRLGRLEGAVPEINRSIERLNSTMLAGFAEMRTMIGPALERGARYAEALAKLEPRIQVLEADLASRQEAARRWAWLGRKATWAWGAATGGVGAAVATWWPKIHATAAALFSSNSSPPPPPPGLPG